MYKAEPIATNPMPDHQIVSAFHGSEGCMIAFLFNGSSDCNLICWSSLLIFPVALGTAVGFSVCVGSIWGGL